MMIMYPEMLEFSERMPLIAKVARIDEYPYHWHDAVEIILVLEGQAEITRLGETQLLKENDIIVVNVDEPHRIKKHGGANRLLLLQIGPDFCRHNDPDFDYVLFWCCSARSETEAPEKYRRLKERIAWLAQIIPDGEVQSDQETSIKAGLAKLLTHMTDSFDYLRYGAGTRRLSEAHLERHRRIYDHVRQNPLVGNSLAELAGAIGVTPQHLSNDIHEKFGFTLRELIFSGNCLKAVRMLLSTEEMIYEISPKCGFSDPKYLIKSFKQFYGCTPSDFRKRHKVGPEGLAAQTRFEDFPLSYAKKYLFFFQQLKNVNA